MESKSDTKGVSSEAKGEPQPPPKNIVVKFCEHAFKVLNHDLDDFFEDNMSEFDQENEELTSGQGETLQQYEVYQKYVVELEKHFDSFAADEGFDSVLSCFTEINELVVQDKADRVRMLRELAHRMQDMQEAWQQKLLEGGDSGHGHREGHGHAGGDSKADSKDAGESKAVGGRVRDSKGAEEEEEAKADSKQQQEQEREAPPVVMFFQPVPMEDLLGYVLSMTEYTTFSVIMRTKVKQAKLLTIMTRRVQAQGEAGRARARLMQDGGSGALEEVYCELVRRVCGLAPQQAELQHELRAELAEEDWGDMLASVDRDGGEFSAKYKAVFKRLVMCVCMSIWQSIVSQEAQQRVRLQLCRFLPQIDQLEGAEEVRVAAAGFLDIGHALLDETEQGVVQVLQAHSRHHRQRRLQEEEEEESGGRGEAK